MEGAPAKAKGRRRPARKQQEGSAAAAVGAAPAAARPAATGATEATEHTEGEDGAGTQQQQQPQPSLSQRLARSLKQLSQLGAGSNIQVHASALWDYSLVGGSNVQSTKLCPMSRCMHQLSAARLRGAGVGG